MKGSGKQETGKGRQKGDKISGLQGSRIKRENPNDVTL